MGDDGHLFRLTCSVVLQGGMNTANKYHWCEWGVLDVSGFSTLMGCVLSRSTLLRLQVALHGNCLKRALGYMQFSGLSSSGSGS